MKEKELLEYIAKSLVDDPNAIEIKEVQGEGTTILELKVGAGEVGKVIGKQGRIANSIRTVVKAVAKKEGRKIFVDILP